MTATAQEPAGRHAEVPDEGAVADAEAAAPVVRRPRDRRSGRRSRTVVVLQAVSTVLFVALVAGLAWVGYNSSLLITGGTGSEVTNPKAPGYVAEVKPTPVDLVAFTALDGSLVSGLVVTAGADGKGGTVVPLPKDMSVPSQAGVVPPYRVEDLDTLQETWADGGMDSLRNRLGEALTFGFTSVTTVRPDTLQALAELAGPVTITNPDNLLEQKPDGSEVVRYKAGQLTLQPSEVLPFLAFGGSNESVPNQELRHQAVWQALLGALATKDRSELDKVAASTGGEDADTGLPELLAGLLDGDVRYDTVPLEPVRVPGTVYVVYPPDAAALPAFVVRNVPSPTSGVPGQRARVRLLDGAKAPASVSAVVPKIVAAGGEVTLVGNADSFDVATTKVQWMVPEARAAAEEIATALGVTAGRAPEEVAGVDVDVVVGKDRSA